MYIIVILNNIYLLVLHTKIIGINLNKFQIFYILVLLKVFLFLNHFFIIYIVYIYEH